MARSTSHRARPPAPVAATPAPAGPAAPPLPAWAALCFFLSGAAGLLYEVVWSKELSLLLGNSLHAISTVVAAFLCGLALGAWLLGRRLARSGDGARMYALLEMGIGGLGVVSLPALRALDPLIGAMSDACGPGTSGFAAARFALVFVALLPPTLLMGATLPVLVEHFEHALVGPALARLYAINTLGAVAGSWLGGFLLVPGIGLLASTWAAAALNAAAALIALRFAGAPVTVVPAPPGVLGTVTPAPGAGVLPRALRVTTAVALALSGFAALAFQIAWVRLFGLLLGSSVYSFSDVLGVYLVALALGSALAGRWLARASSLAGLAVLQAAIALSAAAAVWLFPSLPDRFLVIVQHAGTSWSGLFLAQLVLVAAVIFVPCVLLGAVFPLSARLLSTGDGGRAVGRAYAANTLGTIAGSLAAGYLLVPRLGVQGTHVAALGVSAAVALLALAAAARARALPRPVALAVPLGVLAAAALAWSAPAWNPVAMSVGVFRPAARAWVESVTQGASGSLVRAAMAREEVLLYHEGLNGSVLVTRDTLGHNTILRINGKVDASDSDMLTQVLFGLVPGALADSGARTLVIGQGSGVTLGAVLAAGAGHTDIAELEPAVVAGSRYFQAPGHDPLDDPRVHLVLDDGRTLLAHTRERYGLIVSEPSNPWLAGVNNLFTLDFYRLVRSRLAPDGVFAQWIQLYEVSPETFGSILGAFLQVFPHGQAYVGSGRTDLVLVACDVPRTLSLARLSTPQVEPQLRRGRLPGPEAIASLYIGPFDSLRALAGHADLNTDDRPVVEYRAPRDLVRLSRGSGTSALTEMLPRGRWQDAQGTFAEWGVERWFDARARQLAHDGHVDLALAAAADARGAGRAALAERLQHVVLDQQTGRLVARLITESRAASRAGENDEARRALAQAAALVPGNARVWILLGEEQRVLGQPDSALVSLARALAVGAADERRDAEITSGLVEVQRGRMSAAVGHFAAAHAHDPASVLAYAFEAKARLDGGDRAGAQRVLRTGLAIAPDDPRLAQVARALGR